MGPLLPRLRRPHRCCARSRCAAVPPEEGVQVGCAREEGWGGGYKPGKECAPPGTSSARRSAGGGVKKWQRAQRERETPRATRVAGASATPRQRARTRCAMVRPWRRAVGVAQGSRRARSRSPRCCSGSSQRKRNHIVAATAECRGPASSTLPVCSARQPAHAVKKRAAQWQESAGALRVARGSGAGRAQGPRPRLRQGAARARQQVGVVGAGTAPPARALDAPRWRGSRAWKSSAQRAARNAAQAPAAGGAPLRVCCAERARAEAQQRRGAGARKEGCRA